MRQLYLFVLMMVFAVWGCDKGSPSAVDPSPQIQRDLSLLSDQAACSGANVLQGPIGALTGSGSQLVSAINASLAADSQLGVHGGFPGDATTISVVADVGTANRSIRIQGNEFAINTEPGLFLVVIDLTTHTVVDESVGVLFGTLQNFLANNSTHLQGLKDVLNSAAASSSDSIIAIASAGDVGSFFADTALRNLLKTFGATDVMTQVGPNDAYALIGSKGFAEGVALEMRAEPIHGSLAQLTAMANRVGLSVTDNLMLSTINIAPGALTRAKFDPSMLMAVYEGPVGCGRPLLVSPLGTSTAPVCKTIACSGGSGASDCSGTCNQPQSINCTVDMVSNLKGYLFKP